MTYTVVTDKSWSRILDDLEETFRKWSIGPSSWNVQCALPANRTARKTQGWDERRVTVTWKRGSKEFSLSISKQDRAVDNLLVLQLAIEALRLNDKRGIAQTLAEAYRQEFPALPAPAAETTLQGNAYTVLHVHSDAPIEVCEASYRALAKLAHPDNGGSAEAMARLNTAIELIRKVRG